MTRVSYEEGSAFQDAWDASETDTDGLYVFGLALRRASGNPVMRKFRDDAGDVAFTTYFNELHPLSDEDIDYVMGKLAWQAAQVQAQIPRLPLNRYKEARTAVAADRLLQRYVDRVNSTAQSAWRAARYVYGLPDPDERGMMFVESMRRLGLPARDAQLKAMCSLVLMCKPSYVQEGRLRSSGGIPGLHEYTKSDVGSFGFHLIELLHTRVPVG